MPGCFAFSTTEQGPPLWFPDIPAAKAWCKAQAALHPYEIVEDASARQQPAVPIGPTKAAVAYLVLSDTDRGVQLWFDTLAAAKAWCQSQTAGQRYKVVEIPNENGKLPVIDVINLRPVFTI